MHDPVTDRLELLDALEDAVFGVDQDLEDALDGGPVLQDLRDLLVRLPALDLDDVGGRALDLRTHVLEEADEVVCLETPSPFLAIGLHFDDFSQVSDEAVVRILGEARKARPAALPMHDQLAQ